MEDSILNDKHRQALVSIYNDLDWLCETLSSNTYIQLPSDLRNSRNSLRHVLIDCGVLENHFACENCGNHEWQEEVAVIGRIECSNCDSQMKRLSTRVSN